MYLPAHVWRLVVREPRRTVATALGVAIASALVVAVILFGSASGTTVTRRALADVPVDAQAILEPGVDRTATARAIASDPAVTVALPVDVVHFESAALNRSDTATQTSSGVVLGIDAQYPAATGLFRVVEGASVPGDVTISRDLATNLGATPGDTIVFSLSGGSTAQLRVAGIVDITGADLVLGPTDAAHRAAGANPPSNVAITDLATASALAARVPPGAQTGDSTTGGGATGTGSAIGTVGPAVRHELDLRYDHTQLPGDPVAAQQWLDLVRRRIEGQAGGTMTIADDAAASLEPVATDLAWGRILFVFLALPGIVLALTLSRFSTEAAAEANRRQAALLRARGMSQRRLTWMFVGVTLMGALIGAIGGAFAGFGLATLLFGSELAAAAPGPAVATWIVLAIGSTAAIATLAALPALREQLRAEIVIGRQDVQRARRPLWQRLYLDVLAIVSAAVVYVLVAGSGIHPILNGEGDPTVSLAVTSFLAPFLLWIGGALLLLRLIGRATRRSGRLERLLARPLGPGGELAARSLAARPQAASRVIVLLALAVSFAASVLIFDATYRQQQRVDSELTLGADYRAVPMSPVDVSAARSVVGPGVGAATPVVHKVVYVGSEAQDIMAVDPTTLGTVSPLSDSFFANATAMSAMGALATTPDAILVSAETARDYSLVNGDRVRIRIPDAHGQLRQVDFRMAGVALEFPTAPKDAFLVANIGYVVSQTGDPTISFVLARATGDPSSAELGRRLGAGWAVTDLTATNARLANGVTSVDLRDLVVIDVAFALLIAGLGVALFLLAGLADRRREFATLEAVGAEPRHLRAVIAGEAVVVGIAGWSVGVLTGTLVGGALLTILAGVFDPPASVPAVPLGGLGIVGLAVTAGLAASVAVASGAVRRIVVLDALRER